MVIRTGLDQKNVDYVIETAVSVMGIITGKIGDNVLEFTCKSDVPADEMYLTFEFGLTRGASTFLTTYEEIFANVGWDFGELEIIREDDIPESAISQIELKLQ